MLSASQIATWDDCPRKWAWQSVRKLRGPPGHAAELGSAVHGQIEQFLKFRKPLDLLTPAGQIAATGAHLWPRNVTIEQVERPFKISLGAVPFRGFVDLDLGATIVDHKTTSNFGWAKTPEQLTTDPQAVLYAAHAIEEMGDVPITLRWIYYRTLPPHRKPAEVREARVTLSILRPTLERIERSGAVMELLAARNVDPLSLPPDVRTCEKYGGCAYRSLCNMTPQEKLEAHMNNIQDAIAKLAGTVNPGAVPPPPPAVVLSPDGCYRLENGAWALVDVPPPPPDPAEAERARMAAVAVAQGLPPAPGFPPQPEGHASAATAALAATVALDAAPAKRGRGRPKKIVTVDGPAAVERDEQASDDHDRFVGGLEMALEGVDLMARSFARRFFL